MELGLTADGLHHGGGVSLCRGCVGRCLADYQVWRSDDAGRRLSAFNTVDGTVDGGGGEEWSVLTD